MSEKNSADSRRASPDEAEAAPAGRSPERRGGERRASAAVRSLSRRGPSFVQDILDSISDGVVVAGRDGRFLLFNPAAEKILGLGARDVPASEWSPAYGCFREDRLTPLPAEELPLARAIQGETVTDCEFFIRNEIHPEGRWISVDGCPLRDAGGDLIGGVAVFRDITERRSVLERMEFLSNAVEQTADMVVVTDTDGEIVYVNPAFERITGYARHEVLGKNPSVLKSGVHPPEFYRELWRVLLAGDVYMGTLTNRRKNGEIFYCEHTMTPLRDGSGAPSHYVSVGKDVTELRKAAELESQLRLARVVQQRLHPKVPPSVYGVDIAGSSLAADIIGGDYFDFLCHPNGSLGLVIGDVTGHGVDAALLMAGTRAFLRSTAGSESDPAALLAAVNRLVAADTADNQFITLLVACLDPVSRTLTYSNAGHTPGCVLDATGAVKVVLDSTSMPLGAFPETEFPAAPTVALAPGDLLVLFTDGVTEAESPDEAFFGVEGALDVVRRTLSAPASSIVAGVHEAVQRHTGGRSQDDRTCVVCKLDRTT